MRTTIIASALALLCSSASADVVYNWRTTDPAGSTSPLAGQLVVDDAAWIAAGRTVPEYSFTPTYCTYMPSTCAPGEERGDPNSPILEFNFYVDGQSGGWAFHAPREGRGFEDAQTFAVGHGLGSVFSGGTFAAVRISGGEIVELWADGRGGNCWRDVCAGVRGEWVLDESTAPIPEPGTLPAAGIALAAFALARRRLVARHGEVTDTFRR